MEDKNSNKEQGQWKTITNIVDIYQSISIITLDVSGLNIHNKKTETV